MTCSLDITCLRMFFTLVAVKFDLAAFASSCLSISSSMPLRKDVSSTSCLLGLFALSKLSTSETSICRPAASESDEISLSTLSKSKLKVKDRLFTLVEFSIFVGLLCYVRDGTREDAYAVQKEMHYVETLNVSV